MTDQDRLLAQVASTAHALVTALEVAKRESSQWRDGVAARELVFAAFDKTLTDLRSTGLWGEANRLPSSELWRIAGSWLSQGELLTHARLKPRGYAGDYEMLAKIITSYRGQTQPGALFDEYFQTRQAPCAVRRRTEVIASQLWECWRRCDGGRLRVVSIGSGPAFDIGVMLSWLTPDERGGIDVTLLDLDPKALEIGSALMRRAGCGVVRVERTNLFRLAKNTAGRALLEGSDFTFCTGFFDYLEDAAAAELLGAVWSGLTNGGAATVFNFSPANESRDFMEWIGNWYLIYRDETQLRHLAVAAGIPLSATQFGSEATGVDLFVRADKHRL